MHRCLAVLVLAVVSACAEPFASSKACETPATTLDITRLSGRYRVTFSPGVDSVSSGMLMLEARSGTLELVSAPALPVTLAVRAFDTPPSVYAQINAAPDSLQLFDADWFTLFFRRIDADGIQGAWTRGTSNTFPPTASSGSFCGVRLAE